MRTPGIGSSAVEAIAFSPGRITLATGGQYGTTQLWNLGRDAAITTGRATIVNPSLAGRWVKRPARLRG